MEIKQSEFITSATSENGYPDFLGKEFVFVGKSNVGKSTLINYITNRKKLAKTSKTPGRTQLINFFLINRKFYFVDLPGYGYAKVPEYIKKDWGRIIEEYLHSEREKHIFLLLDLRRVPSKDDLILMEWFKHYDIEFTIIFTKSDKLSNNQKFKQLKEIKKKLDIEDYSYVFSSTLKKVGKNQILDIIGRELI